MKKLALAVFDCSLSISSNDAGLLKSLSEHFSCCVIDQEREGAVPLTLTVEKDAVVACLSDGEMRFPRDNMLNVIEDLVVMMVQRHRPSVRFIHCSCVDAGGAAAILVGASTHGKTTLALGLQRAGLGLLAEDKTPLNLKRGTVWPFLTSPTLRANTVRLLGESPLPAAGCAKREAPLKAVFFLSLEGRRPAKVLQTGHRLAEWQDLFAFVYARPAPFEAAPRCLSFYDESAFDTEPEIESCSSGSVVRRLLPYFFANNLSVGETLRQSVECLKTVRGYVLRPGRLASTIALVQDVMAGAPLPL